MDLPTTRIKTPLAPHILHIVRNLQGTDNLDQCKQEFNRVGWFVPPYVSVGFLKTLAGTIRGNAKVFDQQQLQRFIAPLFSSQHLAAMVTERYPITPYVREYREIISEAIEAHFMGLDHVAVAGLMPVIEGAGKTNSPKQGCLV